MTLRENCSKKTEQFPLVSLESGVVVVLLVCCSGVAVGLLWFCWCAMVVLCAVAAVLLVCCSGVVVVLLVCCSGLVVVF